ncbi:MAG TPA: helix-turn-helix transcriptional regulator [Flavisolibacter sp.]|jgi:putative transcriptional regulator|nr:helix-turn-helix transcriptional regulator [Flavisolibacter sp.]
MENRLKQYRDEKSITQEQLATLVGVSRQSIISIEKSQYVPTTILALKLAQVLKLSVEELFILEKSDWK